MSKIHVDRRLPLPALGDVRTAPRESFSLAIPPRGVPVLRAGESTFRSVVIRQIGFSEALGLVLHHPPAFASLSNIFKDDPKFQEACFAGRFTSAAHMTNPTHEVASRYQLNVERLNALGIQCVDRFDHATLDEVEEIIYNRSLPLDNKKPVALVISARDGMGIANQNRLFVELIRSRGYHILYYEPETCEQFSSAVIEAKEYARRCGFKGLQFTYAGAHGDECGALAYLGKVEEGISTEDLILRTISLHPAHVKALSCLSDSHAPGAVVVLDICFSGVGGKDARNLAKAFSGFVPDGTVFAQTVAGVMEGYSFGADGQVVGAQFINRLMIGHDTTLIISNSLKSIVDRLRD